MKLTIYPPASLVHFLPVAGVVPSLLKGLIIAHFTVGLS